MGNEFYKSLPAKDSVTGAEPGSREELYDEMVAAAGPGEIVVVPAGYVPPTKPATNPKEGAGAQKPPVWSVFPRWVMLSVGRVMQIGAAKYDAFNYRIAPVQAMTYVDAIERHLQLWQDGEEIDEETGESHLASVIAGCGILMDTQANGTMGDNRPKTGLARKKLDELIERAARVPLPPKNPNAPSMQKAH